MTEQENTSPIESAKARKTRQGRRGSKRWDVEAVAHHLRTEVMEIADADYGLGQRFLIGIDAPVASLELYPDSGNGRLITPELKLELHRLSTPKVPEEELPPHREAVLLESLAPSKMRLSISAEGAVTLFLEPSAELTLPKPEPQAVDVPTPEPPADISAEEKQQRVTLQGRVGAEPTFRTTSKDKLVGRFPLAVHERDETTWHQVVLFGDRAKQIQGTVHKGQAVEIVGYLHQNERQSRDGSKRLVEELYAVAVRQPSGPSSDR